MAQGEIAIELAVDEGEAVAVRNLSLAPVKESAVPDRRLEDWIAGNLDGESERPATNLWTQLIGNLPKARRTRRREGSERGFKSKGCWERFSVVYKRGITIVRLTERSLVQRIEINALADDLNDLIGAGNHRIVVNFAKVERLGSWIVAAVVEAHRRCEAAEGGLLKICGLTPQLGEIFHIIGMGRRIVACADEQQAVDGPWSGSIGHRALPVDILEALVHESALPCLQGGAPVENSGEPMPGLASLGHKAKKASSHSARDQEGKVWLRVEYSGSQGPLIAVSGDRFIIGRDRSSHLRLGSAQVSKRHAAIEVRGDRAFLRDLGSTNGTLLNGEPLRDAEVELHSQDRIGIGPAHCRIWTGVSRSELEQIGEISHSGDLDEIPADDDVETDAPATAHLTAFDQDDDAPAARIKCEVIQEVLVVTPVLTDLEGEEINEALRLRLLELAQQPVPRQVVVNLEFVSRLSRQTIGVLLAHHLRLDRVGGAVRICEAHPRIMALLDQVRLTMLVDCYPSLDEAVLASWTHPSHSESTPN